MTNDDDRRAAEELLALVHGDRIYDPDHEQFGVYVRMGIGQEDSHPFVEFVTAHRIAAERRGMERAAEWQDIANAPKDGTACMVVNDRGMFVADFDPDWSANGWWMVSDGKDVERPLRGDEPTHWMPLPAPPAAINEGG